MYLLFSVHPTQAGGWKKQALAGLPDIFGNGPHQIRWTFSRKELPPSTEDKRSSIDPTHRHLSIQQQCELLGVPRSTYYYQPMQRRPNWVSNTSIKRAKYRT